MSPARQCPRGCPVQEEYSALSYDARSITVLEGLEAVRKRPGMYIGSTGERGLHHLVYEVVDNAVDEALAGFADRIEVTLLADGGVRVVDNGRGIPVDEHPVEHRPAVEVVLTTLHSGGKFDGQSYAVSGGLHGVGVSVVNALSSRLEVEIRKDGYVWRQSYAVSEPVAPLQRGEETGETGTIVTFWPDPDIFESTVWSFETLSRRLQEMAFLNRGLAITMTDERPDHVNGQPNVVSYRYEGGIADFVRYLNASKESAHDSVIEFGDEEPGIAVEVAMQWSGSFAESVHTFANTINTAEGGTHEEGFRAALTSIVNRYAREQNLLREKDDNLTDRDHPRQARRAAVRGPDQDQARQHRGQVVRAAGLQRAPPGLVRAQSRRGQVDRDQGHPGGPGQDRRPPGQGPDPEERHERGGPAGQAVRLPVRRPGDLRDLRGRG